VRVQNVIPRFTKQPGKLRWVGKNKIGADTDDVLADLGYTPEEVRAMETKGIVKRVSRDSKTTEENA
jgi:crotonobetainyl-CoA:carnitine CoA-transferase CaiB-like acyl-CoA transferase